MVIFIIQTNRCVFLSTALRDVNANGDAVTDCSNFLAVTIIPPTSTVTLPGGTVTLDPITVTQTVEIQRRFENVDIVAKAVNKPTTVKPTTFPPYATACSYVKRYASACSCLGVTGTTTSLTTPTIEVNADPTIVQTTTTATVTNIVRNGGFESGVFYPWVPTVGNPKKRAYGLIMLGGNSSPSQQSTFCLHSFNMYDDRLFEVYQDIYGVSGTTYDCSYDFRFTNYYETLYGDDPNPYIPYVHVYINDDYRSYIALTADNVNQWLTATFSFTSQGKDRFWFDCASPQKPKCRGGGDNFLAIDNVVCIARGFN